MKELLKECKNALLACLLPVDHWVIKKINSALDAEEKREPDAWMHKLTGDVIPAWEHLGEQEQWYTRPLYRPIAPPQAPCMTPAHSSGPATDSTKRLKISEHETPANSDSAPDTQPADGATPCPTCQMPAYNKGKGVRFFVGNFPCADSWHDSTPIAPPQVKSEPEKVAEEDAPQPDTQPANNAAPNMQAQTPGSASKATTLPDGSAFTTLSMPLPQDHWLYAPLCNKWDNERDTTADTPHPILDNSVRDKVITAARYAIRGATMCGRSHDFDPDALALNFAYAVCGPANAPALKPADGAAQCPRYECKVCGAIPDKDGCVEHGKGCYMVSKNGGGTSYVDLASTSSGGGDTPVTDAMFTCSCSWDEAAIRHWSKPAAHFIDLSRMLERQRDAALRELNELKSKLAHIPTAQYCTPPDK